jgi:hypothetical protein
MSFDIKRSWNDLQVSAYENRGEIYCSSFLFFMAAFISAFPLFYHSVWMLFYLTILTGTLSSMVFIGLMILMAVRDAQIKREAEQRKQSRTSRVVSA